MRKFIVFMLSVLVIFAMCSCQPTAENMDGTVEFKVCTDTLVSKALTANDPGKKAVKSIVIKFTPVNQHAPVGASDEFEFGLIKWNASDPSDGTNGDWDDTKHRFLSQGQWKIEAIATTKTSGTVAESDAETLYYGFVNVYISKVNNSASVKMTPKVNTDTGTLKIGYDENGASLPISSKAVVSADPTKQRLTYTIYDITGVQKATGTLDGTTFTAGSDGVDSKIKYANATVDTLTQGSYIVAMVVDQKNGDSWITSTGGSAVDVAVYKGLNTFVWGEVSPSDYIHTSLSTSMDIDGGINLTVAPSSSANKSFTASVTYEVGSDLRVDKYLWFVDGNITVDTTGTFEPEFDTTADQSGTGIHYGEHIIQCVAVDTTKKVKSEMKVVTIKYNFGTSSWDVL